MSNLTSKEAWHAWRRHCAVDRCPPERAAELKAFGTARFHYFVNRYAAQVGHRGTSALCVAEGKDAWHLLESFAQVTKMRSGKRYKDWLLQHGEGASCWVEGAERGATILMRSVVRDYLRREHASRRMQSFDQSAGDFSLADLLPDPTDTRAAVLELELEPLAERVVQSLLPTLTRQDQQLIYVASLDVALDHPRVLHWLGLKRSRTYRRYQEVIETLGYAIQREFYAEPPDIRLQIARKSLEKIKSVIFLKFSADKSTVRYFKKVNPEIWGEGEAVT